MGTDRNANLCRKRTGNTYSHSDDGEEIAERKKLLNASISSEWEITQGKLKSLLYAYTLGNQLKTEKELHMESNKRWVAETINDGKAEYISFIDIVGGKLKVELTDDVSKAVKYKAEFRADDDSQYVNAQLRRKGTSSLKNSIGNKVFHSRLLTPKEAIA